MKRIILFFLLILGCEGADFTTENCLTSCQECPGIPCEAVCDQLKLGFDSSVCHGVSQDVWNCALEHGCLFPVECENEISYFLECSP